MLPLSLLIDGQAANAMDVTEDLPRAVLISLFSWRRAKPDDQLPNGLKFGWWGDTYPDIANDQIGSRLWLLSRAKLTNQTISDCQDYAKEALQWLIDDNVAIGIDVTAERQGTDRLALGITITRGDRTSTNIRFYNLWNYINAL